MARPTLPRRALRGAALALAALLVAGAHPATAGRSLRQANGEVVFVREPSAAPDVVVVRPVRACRTAAAMLDASPTFSILSAALDADPALRSQLDDADAPFTFFAPTDAAFMLFFDALGVSRKEGVTHPATAAALRFHLLPNTTRAIDSFGPAANATTALGADLTILSPEAVANLARAAAMRAAAANETAAAAAAGNATAGGADGGGAAAVWGALAPALAPVVSWITDDGKDPDGTAFVAAVAGMAGSFIEAITPGAARRRIPRMCEDGCRWTVSGPASAGGGAAGEGGPTFGGAAADGAINNATVLLTGRACSGVLNVVDEVLLPELLGTAENKGKALATVSVGDGAGTLVARVGVPAGPGPRNVTVELVGGADAAPAEAAPVPAAAAAAAAPPPAAPAAVRRRVNPEPVDIIAPVVADAVGKGPPPPSRAADGGPAVVDAAAPARAPKDAEKKAVAAAAPPAPAVAGPAIPPAGV